MKPCTAMEAAGAIQSYLIEKRRYLHQHPELSLREKCTAHYCSEELKRLGYHISSGVGYGFFADLRIKPGAPWLAFRAELDAVGSDDNKMSSLSSPHPQVAHLCGHDLHMAIALGAARLASEMRRRLKVNLRFIFEPSEELQPGGALGMIERGCLDGIDEIYALHNDPLLSVGKLATRRGQITANADVFELNIAGKGCQAEQPYLGLDPIMAAVEVIAGWQFMVTRRFSTNQGVVLSVTAIHGGSGKHSIARNVKLEGVVRTYNETDQQHIQEWMHAPLRGLVFQGYDVSLRFIKGFPAVHNHPLCVARLRDAARSLWAQACFDDEMAPSGGGDDFSYYLQKIPGAMVFLGSGHAEGENNRPLHAQDYHVEEHCLVLGCALWLQIALDFRERH